MTLRPPSTLLVLAAVALSFPSRAVSQSAGGSAGSPLPNGFLVKRLEHEGRDHPFALYFPASPRAAPLVVYLHGAGDRGDDGLRPLAQGLGEAILRDPHAWPIPTVFPQLHETCAIWESMEGALPRVLERACAEFRLPETTRAVGIGRGPGAEELLRLAAAKPARWSGLILVDTPTAAWEETPGEVCCPVLAIDTSRNLNARQAAVRALATIAARGPSTGLWVRQGKAPADVFQEERLRLWVEAVGAEPVLADALLDPRRIVTARLSIVVRAWWDTPPFQAVTEVQLRCDAGAWSWRIGRDTADAAGALAAEPVHGLVCQVARGLCDSGILALEGVVEPNLEGIGVLDSQETTLDAEITTAAGTWRIHRKLPHGAMWDPRYQSTCKQVAAVNDLLLDRLPKLPKPTK